MMNQPWLTRMMFSSLSEWARILLAACVTRCQVEQGHSGHWPIPNTQQHQCTNDQRTGVPSDWKGPGRYVFWSLQLAK